MVVELEVIRVAAGLREPDRRLSSETDLLHSVLAKYLEVLCSHRLVAFEP